MEIDPAGQERPILSCPPAEVQPNPYRPLLCEGTGLVLGEVLDLGRISYLWLSLGFI